MSIRFKTDEEFILEVADIIRNRRETCTASTDDAPNVAGPSAIPSTTSSTSLHEEMVQRSHSVDATVSEEPENAQPILISCLDHIFVMKFFCARIGPSLHMNWPLPDSFNATFAHYFFQGELTFKLLIFKDEIGYHVLVQNVDKPLEYKVFPCDDVVIPTFKIFGDDGSVLLERLVEETHKFSTVLSFVTKRLLKSFIIMKRRTQVEFYTKAVSYEDEPKKPKLVETFARPSTTLDVLTKLLDNIPSNEHPNPTALLMGVLVKLISENKILCSVEMKDLWPVHKHYAGSVIKIEMKRDYYLTLTEVENGFVLNLRNTNYIFITGRLISKQLVPVFDEDSKDADYGRFTVLSSYILAMLEYLKDNPVRSTRSSICSSSEVSPSVLQNNLTVGNFLAAHR